MKVVSACVAVGTSALAAVALFRYACTIQLQSVRGGRKIGVRDLCMGLVIGCVYELCSTRVDVSALWIEVRCWEKKKIFSSVRER